MTSSPVQRFVAGERIRVEQRPEGWILSGRRRQVRLDPRTLGVSIQAGSGAWSLRPSVEGDLRVEAGGERLSLRLAAAREVRASAFDTGERAGLRVRLAGFHQAGRPLGVSVILELSLDPDQEDLLAEVRVADAPDGAAVVKELTWPGGLETGRSDWSAVPWGQGGLLPGDWPQAYAVPGGETNGSWCQNWWGTLRGGHAGVPGALTILETYEDADVRLDHPEGGPTRIACAWLHSLGRMRYPRRLRLCFFDRATVVDLAKRYRRHALASGRFVSLREKIAAAPGLARLIGAPLVHTHIWYHTEPASRYFDKADPTKNDNLVPFAVRAAQFRALHARGVHNAYVHLDGWGFRGYDNLHPDPLPPAERAGGWAGFRDLADTAAELGFTLILHDQYRDYYLDAPSYNPEWAVVDETGKRPGHALWAGGAQELLCSRFAQGHVRKNFAAILDQGVAIRGAYLDVFALVKPDECYHPDHAVSRGECLRNRAACFDFIRTLPVPGGGVVTSECATHWAAPHLHGVHHLPYPGLGRRPGMTEAGATVPLFNLVYHDSLFVPWSLGRGVEAVQPPGDWGFLHALLNGAMVYLPLEPAEDDLNRARIACALNRRVALAEMVSHEFPDGPLARRQRTAFADGTAVLADLEHDAYEIAPPLTGAELAGAFEPD